MKLSSMITSLLILLLTLGVSACAKPQVDLAVASLPNVNPDHSGRPSPVIIKMYELRSELAFKQADFQTLFEKPIQALGTELIAADELVFIPGEARTVSYMPNPETKFIGLVGGFRQMERSVWRVSRSIDSEKRNIIGIELNDASFLLIPVDKVEDWNPEEAVKRYQQQLVTPPVQNTTEVQGQTTLNNSQQPSNVATTNQAQATSGTDPVTPASQTTMQPPASQGYVLPSAKKIGK